LNLWFATPDENVWRGFASDPFTDSAGIWLHLKPFHKLS
jgi:hypothetical protein